MASVSPTTAATKSNTPAPIAASSQKAKTESRVNTLVLKVCAVMFAVFATGAVTTGYLALQAGVYTNLGLLLTAASLFVAYKALRSVMAAAVACIANTKISVSLGY